MRWGISSAGRGIGEIWERRVVFSKLDSKFFGWGACTLYIYNYIKGILVIVFIPCVHTPLLVPVFCLLVFVEWFWL